MTEETPTVPPVPGAFAGPASWTPQRAAVNRTVRALRPTFALAMVPEPDRKVLALQASWLRCGRARDGR